MDTNFDLFLDRSADDQAVLEAITKLANTKTPPGVWTRVANDPSYPPFHRAGAVRELFRRHVVKPMTLADAARLLDGGDWLLDADIEQVNAMGGEIPVPIPPGGTAFVIRLPTDAIASHPASGIYLVLDHKITPHLLSDALMSRAMGSSIEKIHIVDFAFFPDSLIATDSAEP